MRLSKILFTNIPLEEIDDEPDTIFSSQEDNEICHICTKSFILNNTKYNCFICKMPVCLNDSSYYNAKTRICDNCRHESLVEEIWKEKKPIKDKIIEDIQKTIRNSEVKKKVIHQNDDRIQLLKSKIENYLSEVKAQIELLDTESNEKTAINNKKENIVQALMIEGKTKEEFEIDIVEKMAKAHENLQIKKIELDEAQHEIKAIKEKIDIKSKVQILEFKDIKSKLCKICALQTLLHDENHEHQEISKNICNCISF